MAAAAITQQPDGADKLATVQPQLLGVSAKSKLQLAKPLTQKARRIVRNKTNKLIKKRKDVDAALQKEAARDESTLRHSDYLIRQHLTKLDDALASCESRHLRARAKAIEERERYYKWDPSTERAIDYDLLQDYQFKFKHHLGSSLAEREQSLRTGTLDDDASSDNDDGDDADGRANMPFDAGSDATSYSSADDSDSDSDPDSDSESGDSDSSNSDERGAQDDNTHSSFGLDGSFDDHVRASGKSKKRKLVDGSGDLRAEQKKARKEQAATQKDNASSGSQSFPFSVSKFDLDNGDDFAGDQAAIDSMSQPSNLPKIMINGESNFHRSTTTNTDSATICDETTVDTTRDDLSLPNTSGSIFLGNTTPTGSPTDSRTPSERVAAPVEVPWYKEHAQQQLQSGFDDMVNETCFNQRSRRVHELVFMRGALPDTDPVAHGHLPSPPASSFSPDPTSDSSPVTSGKTETPETGYRYKNHRFTKRDQRDRFAKVMEARRASRLAQAKQNRF